RQAGRRDAGDPRSRSEGRWPYSHELRPDLDREAANDAIVEIGRKLQRLVASKGLNIGILASEVATVASVDFQLLGRWPVHVQQLRPDCRQTREVDAGIGEQLSGGSPDTILIDR